MTIFEVLPGLIGAFVRRLGLRAAEGFATWRARGARAPRAAVFGLPTPTTVAAVTLAVALVAIVFVDGPAIALLGGAHGGWRRFLKAVTHWGEGIEILVVSAAILIVCLVVSTEGLSRRARAAVVEVGYAAAFGFAAIAGSGIAGSLIKNMIGRARPEHISGTAVFETHPFAFKAAFASFPSGHSTTAGASAAVLALLFPSLGLPAMIAGAAVAASRILLDAHFPSDAVAGFGFGVVFTMVLARGLGERRLVFRLDAGGHPRPKRRGEPAWVTALAGLLARARRP